MNLCNILSEKFRECRESNPGPLGVKRESYPLCVVRCLVLFVESPTPLFFNFVLLRLLFESELILTHFLSGVSFPAWQFRDRFQLFCFLQVETKVNFCFLVLLSMFRTINFQLLVIITAIICQLWTPQTKPNMHHICATFDSCDVIKMREMRGEVGQKTPKKEDD